MKCLNLISIHALRGEGDEISVLHCNSRQVISIHALRGEGDLAVIVNIQAHAHISIHALRGEGDKVLGCRAGNLCISIHALRGEGDGSPPLPSSIYRHFNPRPPWGGRPRRSGKNDPDAKFQSTPSVGRATAFVPRQGGKHSISIHALRGEGDHAELSKLYAEFNFNPRPPWGGRRALTRQKRDDSFISIHALRGEGDMLLRKRLCR